MQRHERHRKRSAPYSRPHESDFTNTEETITTRTTTSSLPAGVTFTDEDEASTRAPLPPKKRAVPTSQQKPSFFENASNFVINQPIMGDVQVVQNHINTNVLREMLEHVIPGAEYDSSARDTPPRCHPGTRVRILGEIQTHLYDPEMTTRMIWIHGAAGVGKSAIMQTLAEAEASSETTFATLFLSRPNERDDPKKVFTSLAYSFAVLNSEYQDYISERLQDEPTFLGKSMEEQFRRLFITPFLENRVSFGSQRWVVFLDGLDECRGGERAQCRIVDLISESVLCHWTSTPFIWVIASRPEAHLKMLFTKAKANLGSFWDLEVPIDSDESAQDVERYLHFQFTNIREDYPDSVPPLWPSESDFLTLSQASSGLFVFASTLVAYILGGVPVSRLKHILALIEKSRDETNHLPQNPFQMLDLLYTQVMSDVPKEALSTTIRILGFYLLESALALGGIPPSFLVASNVLALEQHMAYSALRKLQSVLDCPDAQGATGHPLRFLHASFSDFLRDPLRSQAYYVDLSQEATKIWLRYAKILCEYEMSRDFGSIDLSWSPVGIKRATLQEGVLDAALERWMPILLLSRGVSTGAAPDVHLTIKESTLIEIFQGLGPTIFTRARKAKVPIVEFLDWLSNHAPFELQKHFLREELPLQNLDMERLIKSLCIYHWCYFMVSDGTSGGFYFCDVSLDTMVKFDATKWVEAKDALWTESGPLSYLVQAPGQVVSRVLGFEPLKSFILIGPIDIRCFDQRVYYVLPYSSIE